MKKLSKIDESVWADIHKRSNGTQTRKEDDVNNMNRDEFFDYLDEHYVYTSKENPEYYGLRKSGCHQSISVPIYQYGYMPYSIYLEYDANIGKFLSIFPFKGRYILVPYIKIEEQDASSAVEPSVLYRLRQNFNVEEVFDMRGFDRIIKYLNIIPDDGGQPTNEFFLKVIDFMNDNIEEPLKKIFIKK